MKLHIIGKTYDKNKNTLEATYCITLNTPDDSLSAKLNEAFSFIHEELQRKLAERGETLGYVGYNSTLVKTKP